MKNKKKSWTKPSLSVIKRLKAEEAVMLACKYAGAAGLGATSQQACKKGGSCQVVSVS